MRVDREIAVGIAATVPIQRPERGNVAGLREVCDRGMVRSYRAVTPDVDCIAVSDHAIATDDGQSITVRHYVPGGVDGHSGSAIVYAHGGGLISGSIDIYDPVVREYARQSGRHMFAVGYRLAPEASGSRPARDILDAVRWVMARADEFHIDPSRVAVMGDSAGGGLAAGAAILARDSGVSLAAQILIYPMLDDRNVDGEVVYSFDGSWDVDENFTGWSALLKGQLGGVDVEAAAAPARLIDHRGLPPAYVEVGELDLFRDESVAYAWAMQRARVSCELHIWPGAPHGFEWIAPRGWMSQEAWRLRVRAIRSV